MSSGAAQTQPPRGKPVNGNQHLAPSPAVPNKAPHRSPNQMAKLATDQGSNNPLLSRLYSSSIQAAGVPNVLSTTAKKAETPGPAQDTSALPSQTKSQFSASMPSPSQIKDMKENDLKTLLHSSSPMKAPARKNSPGPAPARLEPMQAFGEVSKSPTLEPTRTAPHHDEHPAGTPMHIVSRFRATTSNTPKEFTYLKMHPIGIRDMYNPYDLQVVSHKDIEPAHYFTVSAAGVTKFDNGESEFIELKAWEREHRIFHELIKLSVFKLKRQFKAFRVWRKEVRRTAMRNHTQHLNENLFHLHPDLSSPLRRVRSICLGMQDNRIYAPTHETKSLEQYADTQNKQVDYCAKQLKRTVSEIREILETACKGAMATSAALREKEIQHGSSVVEESRRKQGGKKSTTLSDTRSGESNAHKPSYIELSQKRAVCRRLTNYIRLCDYMVINSLCQLAMKAVNDAHGDLQYPRPAVPEVHPEAEDKKKKDKKEKKGGANKEVVQTGPFQGMVFSVEVLFSEEDETIFLKPNLAKFTDRFDTLINDYLRTITAVPRLAQMDVFKVYTQHAMMDHSGDSDFGLGPDVGEMVTVEEDYKNLTAGTKSSLARAFQVVEQYAHTFEHFRTMYLENKRLDPEKVKEEDKSLDWFRDQLQLYKTQSEAIAKIPPSRDNAIFAVNTAKLKQVLEPNPVRCLKDLYDLLPVIAHEKNTHMLEDLQSTNKYLEATPATVEEYVEYMQAFTRLEARQDTINQDYESLRELFALLELEKIAISEEEDQTYRTGTRPAMDKLRVLTQQVEETKDQQVRVFSRNIDDQLEELKTKMHEIVEKAADPMIEDEEAEMDKVIEYVTNLQEETKTILQREKELTNFQEQFGQEPTPIDELREVVSRDINDKVRLWTSIKEWDSLTEEWSTAVFRTLNGADINDAINRFQTVVKQVGRTQQNNPVVPKLRMKVDEWKDTYPVIRALKNENLKSHHWHELDEVIGKIKDANGVERNLTEISDYTLGMLQEIEVMHMREDILQISLTATEEDKLEQMLNKVSAVWRDGGIKGVVEFGLNNHKEQKDTYVLAGSSVEEITAQLEDSLLLVSSIAASKYCIGALKSLVDRWENELRYMQDTLDKWLEFQRNWMYLENIFSSSEIRNQWKSDAKTFEGIDRTFRELMKRVQQTPSVYRSLLMNNMTLGTTFERDNKSLEKVLASLERQLEEKRRAFPRFYFLSNDDLLDILAKIKTPLLIMPHMLKMFDGIKAVTLNSSNDIMDMVSMEGETVELHNKMIKAGRGQVEKWLGELEGEMYRTLRRSARAAFEDFEQRGNRSEWIFNHPAQLVLILSQVFWTRGVQSALESDDVRTSMGAVREQNYKQLGELAGLTGRKLNRVSRSVLSTLITLDVHGRDLVDDMYETGVSRPADFGWTKQLRLFWETDPTDKEGQLFIRQNNSQFVYGYEYIGAQGRLVITPLTDRVYMTVTGAMKLDLGAAPAGPAGTGKTETVKDLAKNLARQCIVYNCSDGVTYKMMEKFFAGLIQTGAWTCLDEFNRINIEVLSVIATQLLEIRTAIMIQPPLEKFTFQGTTGVPIRRTYSVCITMNPGYAGRTELPDNLKVLFRPVAVMTPDFRMIAEVILYSEGFKNAKDLSLKITQLYKLSSEQLSPQDHYDFGMRALKSILVMAGDLKRSQPDVEEDLTLIVACNDSNIPKFVAEDIPLFRGIMQDLFPGVSFPEREYPELMPAFEKFMDDNCLHGFETWVKKGIQFYETLLVRHGVMLVGVTGTGKTESRNGIGFSLEYMHEHGSQEPCARPVHQHVLNPKSVTMQELYGVVDVNTNEWKDGILAVISKLCVKAADTSTDHNWIVFDGPVDTLWIESLNSVLDDSKLLCLDSGERIKLPDTIHMIFEVADLAVASPATVSRCGMVFLNEDDLPCEAYLKKWERKFLVEEWKVQPQAQEFISNVFGTYLQRGLTWVKENGKVLIPGGDSNLITSCCDLFAALVRENNVKFMNDPTGDTILPPDDGVFKERNEMVYIIFGFSFVWSMGGNLDTESQEAFDAFCRDTLDPVPFPSFGSVFDCCVDFSTRRFGQWEGQVKEYNYDASIPFFDILVPTVDTTRYSALIKTMVASHRPVLFSGHTGVGKSVIMNDSLVSNKEQLNLVVVTFQFSAQTNSLRTQELIESKLKAKRKNLLGAPPGRQVVLFIDDLNMPQLEVFGASPPIELIRQMMGNGGFYDRKVAGFWKTVQDVTIVSACGPPEGGRNPVTARLTRMFHLLQIPNLSEESMRRIFFSILNGFFHDKKYQPEVRDLAKSMVAGSIELYQRLKEGLRPRPNTPHYTFNLRDLAKVTQGIMQVIPRTCNNSNSGTRLWIHENMRCFYDRLINEEHRRYFTEELMCDITKRLFPGSFTHQELFEGDPLMWGDFLRFGAAPEDRVYEEVADFSKVGRLFDEYLEDYNATVTSAKDAVGSSSMNLVFFKDHCEHLARIIRIIRQPRGNALLVGVGGSGKQSLTRLAASIAEYRRFEIQVGKGYGMQDFHESLLELYNIAGVKCFPIVFLLSDTQIVNEGMLEDINNMLNSGEVPSLFPPDERDKKINQTMEAARERGFTQRDEIWSYFINRVRDNLHICLCMSPVGDAFRTRCRQFPSLTNCCSVDWFNEWPGEALQGVAERLMEPIEFEDDVKAMRQPLTDLCVDIHLSVVDMSNQFWEELRRHYYITPTSYLEFISLFRTQLEEKTKDLTDQLFRLQNGKQKMKETNATISVMKQELEEKQPKLEQASIDNLKLMENLAERQEKASVVQVSVAKQQGEAAEQQKVASELQAEAQKDLDAALPALEASIKALDALDKAALNEVKSFANPPPAVEKTLQAVMTLFESTKMDWKGAKEFLGDMNMIRKLKEFDKDNIKPQVMHKLEKFIRDEEFIPETVEKTSKACKGLCMWTRAMHTYHNVAKTVAPKKAAVERAQASLDITNKKLAEAEAALKSVEDELAQLKMSLDESIRSKELLEVDIGRCRLRLTNAESLSGSLKSEAVRWEENIKNFEQRLSVLPVEIFLSSACMAYFGAFTANFRKRLVAIWIQKARDHDLPVSDDFSLSKVLGDPMEILQWQIASLPTDETSTENAIIVNMSTPPRRWPLLIDPQGQAVKWITQWCKQERRQLQIVKVQDGNLRPIETAIRFGTTVLLDVGETLDPALEPLLMRQIFAQDGGSLQICLNPSQGPIPYNTNFRLFICTKLANPHYLPDVCIKVTLVNFTVTMEGLEDQMLGEVVAIEQKELEEEKNKITVSISDGQKNLKKMEESILQKLKDAKGNILDDQGLIDELKNAQQHTQFLSKRQEDATEKMKIISQTRDSYRMVARRCAILFFVLADLSRVDPMYQYSLEYFKRLCTTTIEATAKPEGFDLTNPTAEHLAAQLASLRDNITETTYVNICRGLFNKDKTILSLLMCSSIYRNAGDISEPEWQFFVRASALVAQEQPVKPPSCEWISTQQWELLEACSRTVGAFKGLLDDVKKRPDLWKEFVKGTDPQDAVLPGGGTSTDDAAGKDWENMLTPFQKVVLMRCWREEKMLFASVKYVRETMGKGFVEPPPFNLQRALDDSSNTTPIIFILSQGSDPMGVLKVLADTHSKTLNYVSLGQGQGENAKRLIEQSKHSGNWALLQNCHLSKTFMPELESQVSNLQSGGTQVNANFRLWLTSMPTDFFPIPVLQNSIKLTNEAPTGLKANMVRCYGHIKDLEILSNGESFPECTKEHAYKKLVYGLCFFHSTVLERKKFGALGWNVKYEWNDTDFEVSKQWLRLFLDEQERIPWDSLEYIIGQINYGGRVTDPQDRGTLMTVLRTFINRQILTEEYAFSQSGRYRAPEMGDHAHYMSHIELMSQIDDPEVFGMHENANLRFQLQGSQVMLATVLEVQPRLIGKKGGGPSPEEQVAQKCIDFEAILPEPLSRSEAGPTSFTTLANGLPNSLSTVLSHELVKYNKLIKRVKNTLAEMQKALKGLSVMSEDLDKMYGSFLNDQVPVLWSSVGYLSLKPLGAWFKDFVARIAFIRQWVQKGEPSSFLLSGFFNAAAFMTGVLQAYARQHTVSVDKLGFSYIVVDKDLEEISMKPESGVYVHGLFSDAWRWDRKNKTMEDSLPGQPYDEIPVMHFLPEPHHKTPKGYHEIPLYRTTIRAGVISSLGASSNYIMSLEMPTDRDPDYWRLKGAASVCALNF